MQAVSGNKQQKIVHDLIQIDCDLQSVDFNNNECEVRQLIDCRRQLLADLRLIKPINEATKPPSALLEYTPTTYSIEFFKRWRSRVKLLKPNQHSFQNSAFCNQILDSVLPETWNFYSDVMVVSAPPSDILVKKALDRGQRHIVIYDHHRCIDEDVFSYQPTTKIVICQTITDVEIAFAKLQTPAEQVITCLLYTSPSPRDRQKSRMPSSA